jgi:hypothetical protein
MQKSPGPTARRIDANAQLADQEKTCNSSTGNGSPTIKIVTCQWRYGLLSRFKRQLFGSDGRTAFKRISSDLSVTVTALESDPRRHDVIQCEGVKSERAIRQNFCMNPSSGIESLVLDWIGVSAPAISLENAKRCLVRQFQQYIVV